MTRPVPWVSAAGAVLAIACLGCEGKLQPDPTLEKLAAARDEIDRLRKENARLAGRLAEAETQRERLLGLGRKRLEKLYVVQRIRLGSGTGGVDLDGRRGDEAVKVVIEPIDQHGSVIKAAGEVRIRVFDLSADPDETLLTEQRCDVDATARAWVSGFLTYYYSFVCPLKRRPAHEELTVRAEFTDYLTGRRHIAEQVVRITLPTSPATRPARSGEQPAG